MTKKNLASRQTCCYRKISLDTEIPTDDWESSIHLPDTKTVRRLVAAYRVPEVSDGTFEPCAKLGHNWEMPIVAGTRLN